MKSPRGAHYLPIAKIYFVLSSYVIYFSLARLLTTEEFGVYGVVIGIVSVINMLFVNGAVQAVSKLVSEKGAVHTVVQKAFQLEFLISGILFIAVCLNARHIAVFFQDLHLAAYIKIASIIFISYSFYSVYIGAFNGSFNYKYQGLLDILYVSLKTLLILGFAKFFLSTAGAILGFAVASVLMLLLSAFIFNRVMHRDEDGTETSLKEVFYYQLAIMAFAFVINLAINTDLFILKAISNPVKANYLAGLYTGCLTISRIPYMIIVSLNFIIFPLISKATHAKDIKQTKLYITQGMRICLGIALPMGCILSASAADTLTFIYPEHFSQAAAALSVLGIAYAIFPLFLTSATIITGSGKPWVSFLIACIVFLTQGILGYVLIGSHSILGAGFATALSFILGVFIFGCIIKKNFGCFLDLRSTLRILAASAVIYIIGILLPAQGFALLAKDILLALIYGGLLFLTKEIKFSEIQQAIAWARGLSNVS